MTRVHPPSQHGKALLLVGLHSSGKTTLAQAIASTGPFSILELGDGVREEARRRGENNLVRVASEILSSDSPTKLAKLAAKRAQALDDRVAVFVGARTLQERDLLVSLYPELIIVGLATPDIIRRERWRQRQIMASDKWLERERWELRWQTRSLVQQSHIRLSGTESIPSMCKKISSVMKRKWVETHGQQ